MRKRFLKNKECAFACSQGGTPDNGAREVIKDIETGDKVEREFQQDVDGGGDRLKYVTERVGTNDDGNEILFFLYIQ